MHTIPTAEELANATSQHIPHYSYQFPPWADAVNGLKDNVSKDPKYTPREWGCSDSLHARFKPLQARYAGQLAHVRPNRPNETAPNSDNQDPLKSVPHPDSDYRHVDPGMADDQFVTDFGRLMQDLEKLEKRSRRDGELGEKFGKAVSTLADAAQVLGNGTSTPKGMQRLKLLFESVLCQVIAAFSEINAALHDKNDKAYDAAVKQYIELLRDLDDSEPQTNGRRPVPGVSGYGHVIKWVYIIPVIFGGRIVGAKVIAKWNPHISSSGIPIAHD